MLSPSFMVTLLRSRADMLRRRRDRRYRGRIRALPLAHRHPTLKQMRSIRTWLIAVRPVSFTASIIPVLVGTAIAAEDNFDALLFALALAGAVAIHAGTNLVNDYF